MIILLAKLVMQKVGCHILGAEFALLKDEKLQVTMFTWYSNRTVTAKYSNSTIMQYT